MGRLGGCVLVAMVLAVLAAAPARAAEDPAFTKQSLELPVVVGAADDTRCTITANLFLPRSASAAKPVPAVLGTNGFGGSKADFDALGASYATRGYAFLAYSGLGFGGSTCKITLDDPDTDGKAGKQLVSYLGGREDVVKDAPGDPRVGMIGGSYGGQIQFAVAGIDPRVDALVPQITWNDLAYSLAPNNTGLRSGVTSDVPGVVKLDWPLLFFGVGAGGGLAAGLQDPARLSGCPNFADEVCPALIGGAAGGYLRPPGVALLRHASVATYVDRIKVPVLLAQGQSDNLFNLQESLATYRALKAQGTPVKLLWRSAGHSGGGIGKAESDPANPEGAYESRMELAWLDHWLKGKGPRPALDFSFLTDWITPEGTDAVRAVGTAPAYPAGGERRLFLSGTDRLVTDPAAVEAGSASMVAPGPLPLSAGGGVINPGDKTAEGQATSVSWDLPLDADVDVVGPPRLTVRLDAPAFAAFAGDGEPANDLVLFGKLYDVDDHGARLIRNLVSAVRVSDLGGPVTIELPGIVHRFPKGHALRLTLATSELTYRGSLGVGTVAVPTGPDAPGVLTLPTVDAPTGAPGSGPGGTTPFGTTKAKRQAKVRRAAVLPRRIARRCGARRVLRLRLRAPRTLRSARVRIGSRTLRIPARRLGRRIVVRKLPRTRFRVVATARTTTGALRRNARTYRRCTRR